MSGGLDALEDL